MDNEYYDMLRKLQNEILNYKNSGEDPNPLIALRSDIVLTMIDYCFQAAMMVGYQDDVIRKKQIILQ